MNADAPQADRFTAVAEEARRRARAYRRSAWLALGVPLLLWAVVVPAALWVQRDDLVVLLLIPAFVLQFAISPALAILWFRDARRQEAIATRNEQAAAQTMPTGEELSTLAERLRQEALGDQRRLRIAYRAGIGILVLAGVAAVVVLATGKINWWAIKNPAGLIKGILFLIFALLGPARWLSRRVQERQGQAELIGLSESLGFRYVAQPVEAHLEEFGALPLLRHGKKRQATGAHLLAGELAGRQICTLVYTYADAGGRDSMTQTVALTPLDPACPDFRLWPPGEQRGVFRRMAATIRRGQARAGLPPDMEELPPGDDLDTEASGYLVFGRPEDRERLAAVLSEEALDLLAAREGTVAEAAGGLLAVYKPGEAWALDDYARRIAEALALAEALDGRRTVARNE
jgi:hypothetical protein